ncbi:MarR family transcriptional regulator [Nocardia cyriacigeorgica]|uniref:MarR family transcriptional regulator n=1 Tax=Nocardia cyriacigeorgica TaxID=135487 RepID=A0A6P1CXS8_9NOCA|nr:MarR family transcriptional regulator [Nocardia cyriacigeorgica]
MLLRVIVATQCVDYCHRARRDLRRQLFSGDQFGHCFYPYREGKYVRVHATSSVHTHAIGLSLAVPKSPTRSHPAVGAWAALLQVHARLVPELDAELRRATGLPLVWYDVLLELDGPRQLRMSDLGSRVVLSRTRVSRLVTELEAQDLVRRDANPDDGRSAFVSITEAGRTRLREAAPHYLAGIERRFAGLSVQQLEVLTGALRTVLGPAELPDPQAGA